MIGDLRALAILAVAATSVSVSPGTVAAQSRTAIHFEHGNDNGAARGAITGKEYADYVLGAQKGQTMSVAIAIDSTDGDGTIYFNILPPESDNVAIFNGSTSGDFGSIKLPQSGDYTIRVYLMGNDADTRKTVHYTLSMTIM
ncbi:MAG: hypothetical protein KDA73_04985 [Rhodobacteraceae bacterium]|nr:hypothetical protein [Paracoccaceae bacterium]